MTEKDPYEQGYENGESSVTFDWLFALREFLDIEVEGPMALVEYLLPRLAKWQPIETAPKDETWVLVYEPERQRQMQSGQSYTIEAVVRSAHFEPEESGGGGRWWVGDSWDSDELKPTHWMPLPEEPK